MAVNIFCREAQEAWEELFPFADDRSLKLAAEHGLPDNAAELAELVDNDRHKFVRLLAALIRSNLRKVPVDDEKATVDSGEVLKHCLVTQPGACHRLVRCSAVLCCAVLCCAVLCCGWHLFVLKTTKNKKCESPSPPLDSHFGTIIVGCTQRLVLLCPAFQSYNFS